jgi:peptide/nickel transport system permease protein
MTTELLTKPSPTRRRRRKVKGRGFLGLGGTGFIGYVSAAIIFGAILLAILGPVIRPYDPNLINFSYANVGSIAGHPLGFDGQGRDLLSRLMVGARTSVIGPMSVALLAVIVGSTVAIVTAWFGGWFDTVVSAVLDILFSFPGILLAVVAAAVFGPSLFSAVLALAIAYAPYVARVLRGAALRERAQAYVAAMEVQGFGAWRVCAKHLLPNIASLIVAQGTILFGWAMVDIAAVSFLGLGVQAPTADWGVMISEGKIGLLQGYPLESFASALCIIVVVSAVSVLGERLNQRSQLGYR